MRIDLRKGEANILISDEELAERRIALEDAGGYPVSPSATPWQEFYRATVGQLETGAVMEPALKHQRVASAHIPKDSH